MFRYFRVRVWVLGLKFRVWALNSLKVRRGLSRGVLKGISKGDTRSLDYSCCGLRV